MQVEREKAINDFKKQFTRILIATDVASRGLDIPNIACVIIYDMPNNIDSYVHRIGRTGRIGNTGIAISFIDGRPNSVNADVLSLLEECKQEVPDWFKKLVFGNVDISQDSYSTPSYINNKARGYSNREDYSENYQRDDYTKNASYQVYNNGGNRDYNSRGYNKYNSHDNEANAENKEKFIGNHENHYSTNYENNTGDWGAKSNYQRNGFDEYKKGDYSSSYNDEYNTETDYSKENYNRGSNRYNSRRTDNNSLRRGNGYNVGRGNGYNLIKGENYNTSNGYSSGRGEYNLGRGRRSNRGDRGGYSGYSNFDSITDSLSEIPIPDENQICDAPVNGKPETPLNYLSNEHSYNSVWNNREYNESANNTYPSQSIKESQREFPIQSYNNEPTVISSHANEPEAADDPWGEI